MQNKQKNLEAYGEFRDIYSSFCMFYHTPAGCNSSVF